MGLPNVIFFKLYINHRWEICVCRGAGRDVPQERNPLHSIVPVLQIYVYCLDTLFIALEGVLGFKEI